MLPALITAITPVIFNVLKETLKEKAPKEIKDFIDKLEQDPQLRGKLQEELLKAITKYNEQLLKELEIRERYKNINKISQVVRPFITFISFITFEVSMIYGLYSGKLTFSEFINVFTPINTMLLGFWFGERSALKDPKKALTED